MRAFLKTLMSTTSSLVPTAGEINAIMAPHLSLRDLGSDEEEYGILVGSNLQFDDWIALQGRCKLSPKEKGTEMEIHAEFSGFEIPIFSDSQPLIAFTEVVASLFEVTWESKFWSKSTKQNSSSRLQKYCMWTVIPWCLNWQYLPDANFFG